MWPGRKRAALPVDFVSTCAFLADGLPHEGNGIFPNVVPLLGMDLFWGTSSTSKSHAKG